MSCEGITQKLCEQGHLSSYDYYHFEEDDKCGVCGSKFVWEHDVDETNGAPWTAYANHFLEKIDSGSCECCGRPHPQRYVIPNTK